MKQYSIISTRGGVGKTAVTLALASVFEKAVLVDADTETMDLRMLSATQTIKEEKTDAVAPVHINEDECIRCGLCKALCHFDAVYNEFGTYQVNPQHCQSCDLCLKACPVSAIEHIDAKQHQWGIAETRFGPLLYARLALGEDLNGSLISILREKAVEIAKKESYDTILIDGPPAVGYAVASAITHTDLALVLLDTSVSAVHDLHKAVQLCKRYEVDAACIINKSDINPEKATEIKEYCKENNIRFLGEIPFDMAVMESQLQAQSLLEYAPESKAAKAIVDIAKKL